MRVSLLSRCKNMYRVFPNFFITNFLLEGDGSYIARESFQSFSSFYRGKSYTGFHLKIGDVPFSKLRFFADVEPLDPNVSSVPRTIVLAQGSQGSKGLPYLCIRGANYLSDLLCAPEEST